MGSRFLTYHPKDNGKLWATASELSALKWDISAKYFVLEYNWKGVRDTIEDDLQRKGILIGLLVDWKEIFGEVKQFFCQLFVLFRS